MPNVPHQTLTRTAGRARPDSVELEVPEVVPTKYGLSCLIFRRQNTPRRVDEDQADREWLAGTPVEVPTRRVVVDGIELIGPQIDAYQAWVASIAPAKGGCA
jgi:hypothetical protein